MVCLNRASSNLGDYKMNDRRSFEISFTDDGIYTFRKTKASYPVLAGWVKVIPESCRLPLPSLVQYANQVPGKILLDDTYVLDPSEIIIEAYILDICKVKNGNVFFPWNYRISGVDCLGNFFSIQGNWREIKRQMRSQGMDKR